MKAHGVQFTPRAKALPFGDYMVDGSNVAVDTKYSIDELVMDVGRDHARFVRECVRAQEAGYKLVILVEAGRRYNDRGHIWRWKSGVCRRCRKCDPFRDRCHRRFKPMQGPTLAKIMMTLERKYNVAFEFCDKRSTGRRICELLGVTYDK